MFVSLLRVNVCKAPGGPGWAQGRIGVGREEREDVLGGAVAQATYGGRTLMVPGDNEGSARCRGWSSRGVQTVLRPGFLPKAGFSSPGSAIAYSAYSIPNVMVNTTFHDYYVPLAVLNTIISTGLSCYSRYPATAPQRAGEAQWKGSRKPGGSGPHGRPAAGRTRFMGTKPGCSRGLHTWLHAGPIAGQAAYPP